MIAAYLIDPAAPSTSSTTSAPSTGSSWSPSRRPRRRRPHSSAAPSCRAGSRHCCATRLEERGLVGLYEQVELPLTEVLAAMETAGVRIDTYRMGEITARLADRVEELEAKAYELAGEEFMLGSTQQVARVLFEQLGLTPGRKGKTGYSTDTRVLRTIRAEHEIVARARGVARVTKLVNTYLAPLPTLLGEDGRLHTTFNQTVAVDRAAVDDEPEPAGDPDPDRARPRDPLRVRRRAGAPAALGRLLADRAADPRARLRRAEAARGVRARRGHPPRDRGRGARRRPGRADHGQRSIAKMINFGIVYGISAFGLSENLEIPREQAQAYIDAYLARFPHVQDFIQRTIERSRADGYATSLLGRRRPVPEIRASNRQTRGARRADRGQLRHAGLERGHHQGGDDPDPRAAARARAARRGSCSRCTTSCCSRCPRVEVSAVKELVREEMCGAYPLDPPLAVDIGVGDDWAEAKG